MVRKKSDTRNRKRQIAAQTKSRTDVKSKIRKCDECHNIVPNGVDMYRFYRTRQTVCKNCWITMDPSKDKLKQRSRQIESNVTETKLCTVFLTDVLDKKSIKSDKEDKTHKNKDNKLHGISDDSSEENKLAESCSNLTITSGSSAVSNTKQGKKRKYDSENNKDVESLPIKITRLSKKRADANEAKVSSDVEQQSTSSYSTPKGRKRAATDLSSDSDISPLNAREKLNNRAKRLSVSSSSRKKLRTILQGITAIVHNSESTDESSPESKKRTRNSSSAGTNKEQNTQGRRTRSSSISSTETTSTTEFKSPRSVASSEVKKNDHACDVCGKKFDTKLASVEHSLTHRMQASLKLERVTISSNKEKHQLNNDSEEDKIKETEVHLNKTKSVDQNELTDDSSEENAINVVDTDDEEIISSSEKESAKRKEVEKEASSESCNVTDKLDAESELCVKESTEHQNDEEIIEESEQCIESTIMSNETVTSIELEENKDTEETKTENINISKKHTKSEDKKASMDRDIDTSKDNNVQEDTVVEDTSSSSSKLLNHELCTSVEQNAEQSKNVSAKSDTKMSNEERKESNSETINDEEQHLNEETTHDSKATRLSISSVDNTIEDNKNHSEDYKSDLENNCKVNENDNIIEDVEMCDLTNKSWKKNTNESEKEITVPNVIDETETLKNQIDLNDNDQVEASEKQQDTVNEQNMETEVIINTDVDKSDSAKDIDLNLLNGEKFDQVENGDEDESNVATIPADSNNDIIQNTEVTEETVAVDKDSKEKDRLEETIKNLENLIENNTTNSKCEERENLNNHTLNDSSTDAANMILKEVFDLAAAEVKKREDINNIKSLQDTEMETLESITREIRNSADMPSLDPISIMDIDDDNDMLN